MQLLHSEAPFQKELLNPQKCEQTMFRRISGLHRTFYFCLLLVLRHWFPFSACNERGPQGGRHFPGVLHYYHIMSLNLHRIPQREVVLIPILQTRKAVGGEEWLRVTQLATPSRDPLMRPLNLHSESLLYTPPTGKVFLVNMLGDWESNLGLTNKPPFSVHAP